MGDDLIFVEHVKPLKVQTRKGLQPINPWKGFFSLPEAAVISGYNIKTLQAWAQGKGRASFPIRKNGGFPRVARLDLVEWVQGHLTVSN